jgi:hypothetical protein
MIDPRAVENLLSARLSHQQLCIDIDNRRAPVTKLWEIADTQ